MVIVPAKVGGVVASTVIVASFMQLMNIWSEMVETPEGIVTLVGFAHETKAAYPIEVALSGIVRLENMHSKQASPWMVVTPEGIVTLVIL